MTTRKIRLKTHISMETAKGNTLETCHIAVPSDILKFLKHIGLYKSIKYK